MEEFTSRPLYHTQGARLDLRRCCADFQAWLDERRRMRGGRRTDWKERRRKLKQARRAGRDSGVLQQSPFWSVFAKERRTLCRFSVRQIIATARKRGELTADQKDVLADRLLRWLTRPYYLDFLSSFGMQAFFFEDYLEPSLPLSLPLAIEHDQAHYRKYVLYAFCAFLGFFRRSLNWQESAEDRKLAASLLEIFWKLDQEEEPRRRTSALRKFITLLFDEREELGNIAEQMAPQAGQPSRAIQKEHLAIVRKESQEEGWEALGWKERIDWLHEKGVLYKGKSIAAAYKNKRDAVVRTLLRVSKESQN